MTQRLVPLSYEEHVVLGAELKDIRKKLLRLVIRTCRGYGVSSKAVRRADRVAADIDRLRCELDNLLCQSLPPTDDSWRGVYYGDNK